MLKSAVRFSNFRSVDPFSTIISSSNFSRKSAILSNTIVCGYFLSFFFYAKIFLRQTKHIFTPKNTCFIPKHFLLQNYNWTKYMTHFLCHNVLCQAKFIERKFFTPTFFMPNFYANIFLCQICMLKFYYAKICYAKFFMPNFLCQIFYANNFFLA